MEESKVIWISDENIIKRLNKWVGVNLLRKKHIIRSATLKHTAEYVLKEYVDNMAKRLKCAYVYNPEILKFDQENNIAFGYFEFYRVKKD
jgi:hypothetical protein